MSAQPQRFREHFLRPQRIGSLEAANRSGESENVACGDWVRLELLCAGIRVQEARVQVRGCSATISCASLVAEAVEGLEVGAALTLDVRALAAAAGASARDLSHAPAVVARALAAALEGAGRGSGAEPG